MSLATKFGRVVTYLKRLSPIKSHEPFIMWSLKSSDKLKTLDLHYQKAYDHQT